MNLIDRILGRTGESRSIEPPPLDPAVQERLERSANTHTRSGEELDRQLERVRSLMLTHSMVPTDDDEPSD